MNSRRSQAIERGSGEAPLRGPWILAVDLGNGGPKVAVVSLDGEVLRVAFRPVRTRIGLDGAATQDAVEWWTGLLAAAREAIAGAGADGASCTSSRSRDSTARRCRSARTASRWATSCSGPTLAPGTSRGR